MVNHAVVVRLILVGRHFNAVPRIAKLVNKIVSVGVIEFRVPTISKNAFLWLLCKRLKL